MIKQADGKNVFPAGVVTLMQWTMFADGSTYQYVFCDEWVVVTNQQTGIDGFRSVERWHLCAYGIDGKVLVVIPGCQVKGFSACREIQTPRGSSQCYVVDRARV